MQHQIVSREEWLAARLGLLKEEKELTRRSDELARRRQELPWVRIDKLYRFDTDCNSIPWTAPTTKRQSWRREFLNFCIRNGSNGLPPKSVVCSKSCF
jgi:hypothetical protein